MRARCDICAQIVQARDGSTSSTILLNKHDNPAGTGTCQGSGKSMPAARALQDDD